MEQSKVNPTIQTDEIDLLELAKTSWLNRKIIGSITFLFIILGVLTALLLEKEYTAGSTFVPQTSEPSKVGGSLGGLASLAGINLGAMGGGSEIPPTLYPKIVSSVNFKKNLLDAKINPIGLNYSISYKDYYDSLHKIAFFPLVLKYTIGLPFELIKSLKSNPEGIENEIDIVTISNDEFEHFKRLEKQISIQYNEKEGFVSLSFIMPEPLISAQMAKFAEELLQKEVIEYKIQNAREQLKFTQERFEEKRIEFESVQRKLANFRDKNQNLSSALVLNQLEKLESEYNFAFNIYTELAKQLEQAKLQVSQDTPIFSVIQPVSVPIEKSAPKRPLIVLIFAFIGMILSLGFVFGKQYFDSFKEQWNK